jgi:hypothetical protein
MTKIFDQTLGSSQGTLDTGANGIVAGYDVLRVYVYGRTDEAAAFSAVGIRCNADSGTNHDSQYVRGLNAAVSAGPNAGAANWLLDLPGTSEAANFFGLIIFEIVGYAGTTGGYKVGKVISGHNDSTAANNISDVHTVTYRSTGPITRMQFIGGSALTSNLITGTRVIMFGF